MGAELGSTKGAEIGTQLAQSATPGSPMPALPNQLPTPVGQAQVTFKRGFDATYSSSAQKAYDAEMAKKVVQ